MSNLLRENLGKLIEIKYSEFISYLAISIGIYIIITLFEFKGFLRILVRDNLD